jgi:serine/threonine protein phosphatase Stp1
MRFRCWATTHPGTRRGHNEDRYVSRPDLGLWAVADGAGGHEDGALASGMIAEALDSIGPELSAGEILGTVRSRIAAVHLGLLEEAARRGPDVMIAATAVVLILRGEHFACLWAGDSRAYRLRRGVLNRITRDHSLVQELVDAGEIAAEQAEGHPRANVVTRAVGAGAEPVALEKTTDLLATGDRFLLCSDGLTKSVPEEQIAALLGLADAEITDGLIAAALAREASDNVTAVGIEVL